MEKSVKEGLEQIKRRRHYEEFPGKRCYLIGVNIDSGLRNIKEWEYEVIDPKY